MDALQNMYWNQNMSLRDISKELGISPRTVSRRMEKKGLLRRGFVEASREKAVIKPDLSWTGNLSYIVSVLLSDGCINSPQNSSSHKLILLNVIDEEFADAFGSALQSIKLHPSKYLKRTQGSRKNQFCIRAYSMNFYNWYKSLSKEEIAKLVFVFPHDFLRGVFDSEGSFACCWYRRKDLKKLQLQCQIRIYNTNEWLIDLCKQLAAYIGFEFRKQKSKSKNENYKDLYRIELSRRNEVLRFLTEINPNIPRKSIQKYYSVLAEKEKNPELYAKIRGETEA